MMLIFLAPFLLLLDTARAVVRQGQSIGPGADPSSPAGSHDKMGPTVTSSNLVVILVGACCPQRHCPTLRTRWSPTCPERPWSGTIGCTDVRAQPT